MRKGEGPRYTYNSTGSGHPGHATRMHFIRRLRIFGYAARQREVELPLIFDGNIDLVAFKLRGLERLV